MPLRQVALISCVSSHKTPWMPVFQDSSGVHVDGLGEGDVVHMEFKGTDVPLVLCEGRNSFPAIEATHFAITKQAGSNPSPTTVEIIREA